MEVAACNRGRPENRVSEMRNGSVLPATATLPLSATHPSTISASPCEFGGLDVKKAPSIGRRLRSGARPSAYYTYLDIPGILAQNGFCGSWD